MDDSERIYRLEVALRAVILFVDPYEDVVLAAKNVLEDNETEEDLRLLEKNQQ